MKSYPEHEPFHGRALFQAWVGVRDTGREKQEGQNAMTIMKTKTKT